MVQILRVTVSLSKNQEIENRSCYDKNISEEQVRIQILLNYQYNSVLGYK